MTVMVGLRLCALLLSSGIRVVSILWAPSILTQPWVSWEVSYLYLDGGYGFVRTTDIFPDDIKKDSSIAERWKCLNDFGVATAICTTSTYASGSQSTLQGMERC